MLVPDIFALVCECGSKDVERRWTSPPMFRMKGEKNGETPGARKYAAEITRKAYEKQEREAGVCH